MAGGWTVIYAQGRASHARSAAEDCRNAHPGTRIVLVADEVPAEKPEWAKHAVSPEAVRRLLDKLGVSRPDRLLLVVSNEPGYAGITASARALARCLMLRPGKMEVRLYAWSGRYTLSDAAGELVRKAAGLIARPFYLAGLRLAYLAFEALRPLASARSARAQAGADPGRVLAISLDLVGDLVWAAPAISAVKERLPDCRLELLVHPRNEELARMVEHVDDVLTYDAPWLRKVHHPAGEGGPGRLANLKARLGLIRRGYGMTLEFRGEPRDHVLAYLTGAPVRAGLVYRSAGAIRAEDTAYLVTHATDGFAPEHEGMHVLERNIRVLERAVPGKARPSGWLSVDEAALEEMRALLGSHGATGGGPLVGIQPGASREQKRWAAEGFAEVALAVMREHSATVVITGGKAERDLGERIAAAAPGSVNLCGATGLRQFAAIVKSCDLFICNETSAISLASAVGTPVVCLMTGVAGLYGPYGVKSVVLQNKPGCYDPVGEHCICPHGYSCLQEITPAEVVEAVAELLPSGKRKEAK